MVCTKEQVQRLFYDLAHLSVVHEDYVAYYDTLGDLMYCYEQAYENQEPIKVKAISPVVDLRKAFATLNGRPEDIESEIIDDLANQYDLNLHEKVQTLYRKVNSATR
ncbi:MAG: hypothetical protein EOP45_09240 [Sphingobacteriaceae bacterium]|nr:MAG: hypothetical protein EOP45_09240 [Sphingobacteriaceae bacterium]